MLNLLTENGDYFILPDQWAEVRNLHFSSVNEQLLSLIIDFSSATDQFYLANPLLINYDCLRNKTLLTPALLRESFLHEAAFNPLRIELEDDSFSGLNTVEITLLTYFYLNPLPFSVSMIARWFTDIYVIPGVAERLANAVFIARTNRDQSEPEFLQKSRALLGKSQRESKEIQNNNNPVNLANTFELFEKVYTGFCYDCLDEYQDTGNNEKQKINFSGITESGYLIEDHAIIIVGLSVIITEFVKLTELKWPAFTDALLNTVPVYLRDYYSIGRLITEKPAILLSLYNEGINSMDIIVIPKDGNQQSRKLEDEADCLICSVHSSAIPLFLRITK